MKKLFLILFMASPLLGAGPKNRFDDPILNDEFQNSYKDIKNPVINYGSASSFTVTRLSVSTITLVSSATITNLSLGGNLTIANSDPKVILNNTASSDSPYIEGGKNNDGLMHVSGGTSRGVAIDYSNGSVTVATFTTAGSGGVKLKGTTDGSSATAGNIGETISASASASFPTSDAYGDLTSIALTSGDWMVGATVNADKGAGNWSDVRFGITPNSGNSATGLVYGDNFIESGWTSWATPTTVALAIVNYRINITSNTTYYFKYRATYAATPTATGRLTAVRIR